MKVKLVFGKGFVIVDEVISLDCPNAYGGIGDITVTSRGGLWTGEVWVYSPMFAISFGSVVAIYTRKDLCERGEEWKLIWERSGKFRYEDYSKAARLLIRGWYYEVETKGILGRSFR